MQQTNAEFFSWKRATLATPLSYAEGSVSCCREMVADNLFISTQQMALSPSCFRMPRQEARLKRFQMRSAMRSWYPRPYVATLRTSIRFCIDTNQALSSCSMAPSVFTEWRNALDPQKEVRRASKPLAPSADPNVSVIGIYQFGDKPHLKADDKKSAMLYGKNESTVHAMLQINCGRSSGSRQNQPRRCAAEALEGAT